MNSEAEVDAGLQRLERKIAREKAARKEAERLLEEKSRALYLAKERVSAKNEELEQTLSQLRETQNQLVEASRLAGMAEVASETLHNVGNSLNSLNTGVNCIRDQIRRSKVTSLTKVMYLFDAHGDDLARFLLEDPKGQQIPAFLSSLASTLVGEQERSLQALGGLLNDLDQVKEVVARQQEYTECPAYRESVQLKSTVIEAVNQLSPEFQESVRIDLQVPQDAEIQSDRHKIIQILLRLLENAREAIQEEAASEISVTLELRDQEAIIAIRDRGCGIPPENLDKIFQHGFTTKGARHGFGLHVAANAAQELGGLLLAESDGLGRGAQFSLTLPKSLPA